MLCDKWSSQLGGNWQPAWRTIASSLEWFFPYLSHGILPSFSSIHGSFAPSSSASNPAASMMHESLFLPSSSSTLNPSPSTLGGLFSSSSTMNPRASSHRSLLPSSSTRLFIDPVGPMPPSIPPSMRMMRFPAPRQETLLFEELFQGCRQMPMYRSFCFAQQQATRGNGGYGWSAPIHYQQAWPQPSPPRLYIDPVGPMPPSIPPSMRMMNFSTTEQETILFEGVFQECRKRPIVGVDDEVDDENVRLELMLGDSATKKPKIDLTLTLEPPVNEGHDSSRPNV
nr:transcription activator GLK2-like isoform X3 [Ipomoea batatas]